MCIRELIQRDWRPHLSPAERDLVSYVCAASIERGHAVLDCTWEQLTKGVRVIGRSLTKWLIPPIGITRATFYRICDALKRKGAMTVSAVHRTCTRIRINLDWTPEPGTMTAKIAISKRRKAELEAADTVATGCNSDRNTADLGSQIETPISYNSISSSSPSEKNLLGSRLVRPTLPSPKRLASGVALPNPVTPRPTSAREALAKVTQLSRARTQERATVAKDKATIPAYRSTFTAAWAESFPGVATPGWTEKEGNMLRASLKARYPELSDRHAFLDYVVRNWTQIVADKFGWMQRPAPVTPSLQFMLAPRIVTTFMDAYAERNKLRAGRMGTAEEQQLARLVEQGMTRDEALVKLGERRALSRQREAPTTEKTVTFAEQQRALINEERKQLLRDRSAPAPVEPAAPSEGFADELPAFTVEPLDPSQWSKPE